MKWKLGLIIAAIIAVLFVLVDITEFSYGLTRSSEQDNSSFTAGSEMTYSGKMKTYSRIAVVKPQGPCPNRRLRDKIAEEFVDRLSKQELCYAVNSTIGIEKNSPQCPKVITCNSIEEAKKRRVEFIITPYIKKWKCWPSPGYKKWQADIVIKGAATRLDDTRGRWKNYTVYHFNFTNEKQMRGTMYGIFNSQHLINQIADKTVDEIITKIDEEFSEKAGEYKKKSTEN